MTTSKKKILIDFVFVILLFISCLDSLFPTGCLKFLFKHIDEGLTILFLIYIIYNYKYAIKFHKKIIYYWIAIFVITILSNILYQYQTIKPILVDALIIWPRFIIGYYFVLIYTNKHHFSMIFSLLRIVRIITVILFALALHDCLFSPFFPKSEFRYFMYSIQLMFPHVTYLAFCAAILLIYLGYTNTKKNNIPFMLMASFLMFCTLRSKAIGFVLVYWLAYIWFIILGQKNSIRIIIISIIAAIFAGWDNIKLTFLDTSRFSPRAVLIKDSFNLGIKHFPLGTGFGTFGTYMAQLFYSPLYVKLGYQNLYGMSQNNAMFLSDSFWPALISETGIIGTVLFILIIFEFLKVSIRCLRINRKAGFSMLMCLAYVLLASIAESAFLNPATFLLFMLFALFERESIYYDKR
ncbi:MAG: hypothetical protein LKF83_02515 [Solobacterium sp.]|jgi:hypothetical protein|nr:hypothetical protein [Solobacterium sp.]